MKQLKHGIAIGFIGLLIGFSGCHSAYVDEAQFVGKWELHGVSMYEGLQVEIAQTDGQLKGKLIAVPDNKYVQLFAQEGDTWLSGFERKSNFAFVCKEARPAGPLFSLYGLPSKTTYRTEFIDQNRFGVTEKGDPTKSTVYYERIP